jgi:hypothetical protein
MFGYKMENDILKVDLDIKTKSKSIKLITERLKFLNDVNVLKFKYVKNIILVKKNTYSVKIYLNKRLTTSNLLLFQSILGDDYKRTAVTFRDYKLGIRHFNRMFDTKRYITGDYIHSENTPIYELIKNKIINVEKKS